MPVKLQVSEVIERPATICFTFIARDHIKNHPRWDPDMEVEQLTDGPIGLGTVIRRRNSRGGTPVDGTMEVVEFEIDRSMEVVIDEGRGEQRGRVDFAPTGDGRTTVTLTVDLPTIDETQIDTELLKSFMKRSATNMKRLVESET